MADRDQLNFRPFFGRREVPCEGAVGDLIVLTPLEEGEPDYSPQGVASVWLCIRAHDGDRPATWARIQYDGIATCERPVADPPQDHPTVPSEG